MNETTNKEWTVYMHTFPNDKKYIGVAVVNEGLQDRFNNIK